MSPRNRLWVGALAVLGIAAVATTPQPPPNPAQQDSPRVLYDLEYPVMDYSGAALTDPVARLQERLDRGEARPEFDETGHGYLAWVLGELGIDRSSQVLVFFTQDGIVMVKTVKALCQGKSVFCDG